MVSVCLPSDALSPHLLFYLGFSYLGRGVSLHGCSSKAQQLLLTLDKGYLLTAALPDCELGVAPLGPPAQPLLHGCGVAPLGRLPWPWARGSSSRPCFCTVRRSRRPSAQSTSYNIGILIYNQMLHIKNNPCRQDWTKVKGIIWSHPKGLKINSHPKFQILLLFSISHNFILLLFNASVIGKLSPITPLFLSYSAPYPFKIAVKRDTNFRWFIEQIHSLIHKIKVNMLGMSS